MNYLLKSNRGTRRPLRTILIAVLMFVVILFVHIIFPRFFPIIATNIGLPFWKAQNIVIKDASGAFGYFMSKRYLYEENNTLRSENELLKGEILGMTLVQEENARLKEIVGRGPHGKSVLASVLKRPPTTPYDIIVVDVGIDEGIVLGDKALLHENGIVGEVVEVLAATSKVKLYSTAGEKIDILLGTSTLAASAVGRGGGNFEAIVPRDAIVTPGELVTLPGFSQYIFGVVENSTIDSARAFQTVLFRSAFTISKLTWVEIITE